MLFDSLWRLRDIELHDSHEPWIVNRYVVSIKNLCQDLGREVHVGNDVPISFRQSPIEVGVFRLLGRRVVLVPLDVDCLVLDVQVQHEHAYYLYEGFKLLDILA